jgi:hypothetical protein
VHLAAQRDFAPTLALDRGSGLRRRTFRPSYVHGSIAKEIIMDTNTLLIILVVLLVLGGGGFYGRGRWY